MKMLFILSLAVLGTEFVHAQGASDYYPIHLGDQWIQRTDSISGEYKPSTFQQEFEGSDQILGKEYYRRSNWLKSNDATLETTWYTWLRAEPTGIMLGAFGESPDINSATIFNPALPWLPNEITTLGHSWEFDFPASGHYSLSVLSISETVTVPAGQFNNCIKIELIITNTAEDTTQKNEYYLAENIGEILNAGWNLWWSNFSFKLTDVSVVPVELASFTASIIEKKVYLKWITKTETNNYGFEIERFIDEDWQRIGFVAGNGTTTKPQNYQFSDDLSDIYPKVTTLQYRLKQIDTDGTIEYSQAIAVQLNLPKTPQLLQNYPNPFNPSTKISYSIPNSDFVTLKIYDILGKEIQTLINEFQNNGTYSINFNGTKLSSGIYLYKLQLGDFVEQKKMLLMQ